MKGEACDKYNYHYDYIPKVIDTGQFTLKRYGRNGNSEQVFSYYVINQHGTDMHHIFGQMR